eukprot:augustus_masked-scaffold_2-processed-gene-18.9-mRNA-1 protein AED:1.00 eAED:1.00 QI:0/0/0/0/1/1/6/0/965
MDQEETNARTQHTETSPLPQEMDRDEARTNFSQNDLPQTPSSSTNPRTTRNSTQRERRTLVRREEQIESRELALAEREAAIPKKEERMNKLLEEVEKWTGNSNGQEEEARGFNDARNQEDQQDGDNSLRSARVSEIKPESFGDNLSDNTMKNNALGSFYAPWSETGSLYVDKKAKNSRYNVPAYDWPQTSHSNTGYPLIQMPLPLKLKILTGDAIEAFLHDFQNLARSVPGISLQSLLTKEVSEALYQRGVDISIGRAILTYLQKHLEKHRKYERGRCLINLEENVFWPVGKLKAVEQVYLFFDEVYKALKYMNAAEMKKNKKKICKIVFQKIPREFDLTYEEFQFNSGDTSLETLKSLLMRRSKNRIKVGHIQHLESEERGSEPVQPLQQLQTSKMKMARVIHAERVGDSDRTIKLMMMHKVDRNYVIVNGLADTGADYNISSVEAIEPYILREEKPKFVKEIEFLDKKRYPIDKVVIAKVILIQKDFKLNLTEKRFFCVRSPPWDDIIDVGKELPTLEPSTDEAAIDLILNSNRSDLLRGSEYNIEIHESNFSRATDIHSFTKNKVSSIKDIPLEEVTSTHFDHLDEVPVDKPIPPILISNMVENIQEEFNEVGIGEGNIEKDEETQLLNDMITSKVESSNLNEDQKAEIILLRRKNITSWGIIQSNARMSSLTPIEVTLKDGARILRSDGYHQTPEEEEFLERKFTALASAGIVERAKNPVWGHLAFVVPKKIGTSSNWNEFSAHEKEKWKNNNLLNRFRMVGNMIKLNKITVPTALNLPNLERQLLSIKNSKFYLKLDILSGFDFLPTKKSCRDIFTLVTRCGAWRMRGGSMGFYNTPALFFERVVNEVIDGPVIKKFGTPSNGSIAWLGDLLIYAETFRYLLEVFEHLLKRAQIKQVRYNLRKCGICEEVTVWCGRQVKDGKWNFSPRVLQKSFRYAQTDLQTSNGTTGIFFKLDWTQYS